MPQKPVYGKSPVLTVPHCFPSNGTVRISDERIKRLYQKTNTLIESPSVWEGLFGLACLLKSKPYGEPVVQRIYESLKESGNGALPGSVSDQIHIARAAYAMFEYNTDRKILIRLAEWLRYLEIEFDSLCLQDHLLFHPADLMEFLVRFYLSSGMKSILRICTKLRASSFDWTTALHTFQRSIPVGHSRHSGIVSSKSPEEMDYIEKEHLINHAESLADGIRFSLFSGLFSGHSHDLSSGKKVWSFLIKHHRALCGGTTADPFLCGNSSDKLISNCALAAWVEAFASQMSLPDSGWAIDELIRIVFNGMESCISQDPIPDYQVINSLNNNSSSSSDPISLYARITRAVTVIYRHAVTLTKAGVQINYLLPARIKIMIQNQPVTLHMQYDSLYFHTKNSFVAQVDYYRSSMGTDKICMIHSGTQAGIPTDDSHLSQSSFYTTHEQWQNLDGFILIHNNRIISENTHHQGICYFYRNHLLSTYADHASFSYAVCGLPEFINNKIVLPVSRVSNWPLKNDQPDDIPVLPESEKGQTCHEMSFYSETPCRIAMFPRVNNHV